MSHTVPKHYRMDTQATREAFDEITKAIADLGVVKAKLSNIYYHQKVRDDTQFVLDNLGQYTTPDNEAHEIIYERLQAAREAAANASRMDEKTLLLEQMAGAYLAIERAYKTVKAV